MPSYEYVCTECNHEFSDIVSIAKRDDVNCPECDKLAKRGVAAPPIHFKGTGWTQKHKPAKPQSIETRTRDISDKWNKDHPK